MRASPHRSLSACTLLLAGAMQGGADPAEAQPRPAVVELFTSEGCSSCPPAETYLRELARRSDVLALSFHVDYWDDLGWRDRFGLTEAVQRQRTYARTLHLASVYTPQVVIDGQADYVGSDRTSIGRTLAAARDGVAVALSIRDGLVSVDLAARPGTAAGDVVLVGYLREALSTIGRGENSGRTLTEINIVRSIRVLGTWNGRAERFEARMDSLTPDATDVAVLVQPGGQGPIIGAASRPLR
jgi:hypothetical protein